MCNCFYCVVYRDVWRTSSEQQELTEADEGQDEPEAPHTLPTLEQPGNQQDD